MRIRALTVLACCLVLTACSATSGVVRFLASHSQAQEAQESRNLLELIAKDFNLPQESASVPAVQRQIQWLTKHPAYLNQFANRARPYLYYLYQEVQKRHLPAELVLLPMIESSYNPFAYSKTGAVGLWQIMPGTATGFGLKLDWWYDGRRDLMASTQAALDCLTYLGNRFNGHWLLAIASYDSGERSIVSAVQKNILAGQNVDFWNLSFPAETQTYLPKLLALATILKHPNRYPVHWPYIANRPAFETIEISTQLDLTEIAKLAHIPFEPWVRLNSGFSRHITPPHRTITLLLPIEQAPALRTAIAKVLSEKRVTWVRHAVQPGESLSSLAQRFKTSVPLIEQANGLETPIVQINHFLLIPSHSDETKTPLKTPNFHRKTSAPRVPELKLTTYTVKFGDSLESIARQYHVTANKICFWNHLRSNKDLVAGATLSLWPLQDGGASSGWRDQLPNTKYRVQLGDTLGAIALKHHVTIADLKRWNHIENEKKLKHKQVLIISPRVATI